MVPLCKTWWHGSSPLFYVLKSTIDDCQWWWYEDPLKGSASWVSILLVCSSFLNKVWVQEGNELQGAASWIRVQIPLCWLRFCVCYAYVVCWSFWALLCTLKKGTFSPSRLLGVYSVVSIQVFKGLYLTFTLQRGAFICKRIDFVCCISFMEHVWS